MRILLVHQNFPGQFLHLAPALKARGHEVLALTAEGNARQSPVPVVRYRWAPKPGEFAPGPGRSFAQAVARGASAARAATVLRDRHGFVPDVIFGHSGWGETLFLREVWPAARLLAYTELMYHTTGLDTDFDPEFRDTSLAGRVSTSARRAHMLQALVDADAAIAPTLWQAGTFPPELRPKIRVIHDGVDTEKLHPDPQARFALAEGGPVLRAGDEVLTYVSRSLEPYRGFHIFLRALPGVLAARPQAQVVIVGEEGQSYGAAPKDGRSWKATLLAELGDRLDLSRVHFVGRLSYARYLSLLQVSRVHAYLTYPFVLSWSLVEALSAGAMVVASRTPPVEEVIADGVTGRLVDFFDVPAWSQALAQALAESTPAHPMRHTARRIAIRDFDLKTRCLPRLLAFVEGGETPHAPRPGLFSG